MPIINEKITNEFSALIALFVFAAGIVGAAVPGSAQGRDLSADGRQSGAAGTPASRATYADLVTMADNSALVVRVQIRRQTTVEPERAPGLAPGFVRLYIEANTLALIAGNSTLGESLVYLVDVPLTAKGKPPKLKKREMILFADLAGHAGKGAVQLQLTGEHAQLDYSAALEARLRPILSALAANDQPPVITGINDALAVPGTLTGESETQIFLTTQDRSPVSLTVLRRPGQPAAWGVSWGEIIDSSASAPTPGTLRWYRLACALPDQLPANANLARDRASRRLARNDYAFVLQSLGPCARALTQSD